MRIGLSIENFNPHAGGAEQWTWQFARALLQRGHEVHVVAQSFSADTVEPGLVRHPLGRIRSRLALASAAAHRLHGLNLDVIHDMGSGWYCDIFQPHGGSRRAALEQNLLLVPAWCRACKRSSYGWLPRYREFAALLTRQYVDDGRLMVALSQRVAHDFRRLHYVPDHRIRVVYNGVDTERFSPAHRWDYRAAVRRTLHVEDKTLLLLIVAHNFRLKGVPALLRAVGRLAAQRKPVHLVIAGGKRLAGWIRQAAAHGAADHVTFVGSIADPVPLYAAADVYVQPTFYDPCSLVVLEALASGLPSITSGYNGVSELMSHGRDGIVLNDPADVATLTAAVERLFDATLRRHMGDAARELAQRHTFRHNIEQLLTVYQESAGSRRAAA